LIFFILRGEPPSCAINWWVRSIPKKSYDGNHKLAKILSRRW
jgi:hypothetical protein